MPADALIEAYDAFGGDFSTQPRGAAASKSLCQLIRLSLGMVGKCRTIQLAATSGNKKFMAFVGRPGESRAVNKALFDEQIARKHLDRLIGVELAGMDNETRNKLIYTSAIAVSCAIDVTQGKSSRPAYAFEWMIGHLLSKGLDADAEKRIPGLNAAENESLPIDFFFHVKECDCMLHVPVKITTRERASQAWVHQRILDAVVGTGKSRGMFVVMAETNRVKKNGETKIQETCVPLQWPLCQKYVAKLDRIYYLDPPQAYLSRQMLPVKFFGDFFSEKEAVLAGK